MCDIMMNCPGNRYDAMVFCLFGSIEAILKIVSAQCEGAAVVIKRDYLGHLISSGENFSDRYSANHAEDYLRQLNIPCYTEAFTLEMGQPFRSLKDAEWFFRIYNTSQDISFDGIRQKLTAGPSVDFPYYLPVVKPLRLLAFQSENVRKRWGVKMSEERHILICGEVGVGKVH